MENKNREYTEEYAIIHKWRIEEGKELITINEIIHKYNKQNDNHNILDLGCGDGFFTEYLNNIYIDGITIGVDNNETLLSICKKKGIITILADCMIPLQTKKEFGIVVSGWMTCHCQNTE